MIWTGFLSALFKYFLGYILAQDTPGDDDSASGRTAEPGGQALHSSTLPKHNSHLAITHIRAHDIVVSLDRVGLYVSVQFNDSKRKTTVKPALLHHDTIEWDDEILLPSELSSNVRITVCAAFELAPMLGNGETLRTFEVSVRELIDRSERAQPFTFVPQNEATSCSSLLFTVEHRNWDAVSVSTRLEHHSDWVDSGTLAEVTDLGHNALLRFRASQRREDLERSVTQFEHALKICPPDHPCRAVVLFNLAMAKVTVCQLDDTHLYLEASISLYRKALDLRGVGHPDRPATLLHFGLAFISLYAKRGNRTDAQEGMRYLRHAQRLSSPDSYEYQTADAVLQIGADMENQAAVVDPAEQRRTASDTLYERFSRFGDIADLHEMILLLEETVRVTPVGHPDRAAMLTNLGASLTTRFERLGHLADLDRSLPVMEEAIRVTPDRDPDRPKRLSNLATILFRRFEQLNVLAELNKAVSLVEEAVQAMPDGDPDKASMLSNFGNILLTRFDRLGNLLDLDRSVMVKEEAVRITPGCGPLRPLVLANYGNSLLVRFDQLHDLADLKKSVSVLEEAVRVIPEEHPQRPRFLSSLGNSLLRRFEQLDDLVDLDKSVSVMKEAVQTTPDDHHDRPVLLSNLVHSVLTRFNRLDNIADLEKSISLMEEAVRATSDDHFNKAAMLDALGVSLVKRFERLNDLVDLEKSVSAMEEAIQITPDGHPDCPLLLRNLAESFVTRFERLRDLPALHTAISYFSRAASSPGLSFTRFGASRRWIQCARHLGHDSLLEAYSLAIGLLPELAWIGLPFKDRYTELLTAADVTRDAAATALALGHPEMAVEWLEQGRSVVWGQLFQLRSPLDELRYAHPDVADQLERLSNRLERASATHERSTLLLSEGEHGLEESLERQAQRHRELAIEREKLLEQVRSLPGFERLLLPKTFSQLRASAHSGPVVLLNACRLRCDALVVMADSDQPVHVPLPEITFKHAEYLQTLLHKLLANDGRVVSPDNSDTAAARGAKPHRPKFDYILSELWSKVVRPVLDALAFSTPGELSRVFWCPTGPFAFLPIHAAGLYDDASEAGSKLSDFVVSSYAPTLDVLALPSEQHVPSSGLRLLVVPQPSTDGQIPLPGVRAELEHVKSVVRGPSSSAVTLVESTGLVEDVLTKMQSADWVHFACHGVQDLKDPTNSGVCLADGRRLRLSDMTIGASRRGRGRGGLAFLSACQTATGDARLSEEAVHLAAGMLFAGYAGVVGTMWSIRDSVAPRLARDVYERLIVGEGGGGGVPDCRKAARALHDAVGRLRERGESFAAWVPFIHMGL